MDVVGLGPIIARVKVGVSSVSVGFCLVVSVFVGDSVSG